MIEDKGKDTSKNLLMINGPLLVHSFTFCLFAVIMTWARFTGGGPDLLRSDNAPWVLMLLTGLCWPSRRYALANRVPAYAATVVMFASQFLREHMIVQISLFGLAITLVIIGAILCQRVPTDITSQS